MTRLEALTTLKEAVEAGQWHNPAAWRVFGIGVTGRAESAFNGSLDAACALHEAMLPGWIWGRQVNGAIFVAKRPHTFRVMTSASMKHARAWLLAILSALIAMETDRDA